MNRKLLIRDIFYTNKFIPRFIITVISVVFIIVICVVHGLTDKNRMEVLINEMIEEGKFIGKFWLIVDYQNGKLIVSKFNHRLTIETYTPIKCKKGDKISFIAQKNNIDHETVGLWHSVQVHSHGTSEFKFLISALSVIIVLIMSIKYFIFDKHSLSLIFKNKGNICRMD